MSCELKISQMADGVWQLHSGNANTSGSIFLTHAGSASA